MTGGRVTADRGAVTTRSDIAFGVAYEYWSATPRCSGQGIVILEELSKDDFVITSYASCADSTIDRSRKRVSQ